MTRSGHWHDYHRADPDKMRKARPRNTDCTVGVVNRVGRNEPPAQSPRLGFSVRFRTDSSARLLDQLRRAAQLVFQPQRASQRERSPRVEGKSRQASTVAATVAFVLVASLMLSWVALYNHAPLVFSDTIAYAAASLGGEIPQFVSPYYGLLILSL